MHTHGQPITFMSCDNIPANGAHPRQRCDGVGRAARTRPDALDRGQRGLPLHHGRPHRAGDVAGRYRLGRAALRLSRRGRRGRRAVPAMGYREPVSPAACRGGISVGATLVDDVDAVRAPQDARAQRARNRRFPISACSPGYEHTCDDMADPLLAAFVRRMLIEETLPTLAPVPGIPAERYVEQSLDAPAQHGDPPPQPPDRHRRLAKDRPAPARSHPRAAAARREA